MGIYIIIETFHGMTFMWDEKTTIMVQLAPSFQVGANMTADLHMVILFAGLVHIMNNFPVKVLLPLWGWELSITSTLSQVENRHTFVLQHGRSCMCVHLT